jgi:hypothetical protein
MSLWLDYKKTSQKCACHLRHAVRSTQTLDNGSKHEQHNTTNSVAFSLQANYTD